MHECSIAEGNPSGTMAKAMQRLGKVTLQAMPGSSKFVKPQSVMYEMDGANRRSHDNVWSASALLSEQH